MASIGNLVDIFEENGMPSDCTRNVYENYLKPIRIMIGTVGDSTSSSSLSYAASLTKLFNYFNQKRSDVLIDTCFLNGEVEIGRGYNTIIAKFMANESNYTHLLILGNSVSYDPQSLERFLKCDKDIIGVAGPKMGIKWDDLETLVNTNHPNPLSKIAVMSKGIGGFALNHLRENRDLQVTNGLLKVQHLGMDMVLIKREAIGKMINHYSDLKYDDDIGVLLEGEDKYLYGLCIPYIKKISKTHFLSSDYAFFERWREIGGDVYCDLCTPMAKTGPTTFQGNYLYTVGFTRA